MKLPIIPPTHISLREFLIAAGMSRGTFFLNYRHNPAYADLLDVRMDRMHRIWLATAAAEALRTRRQGKATHGNRGRSPVRICPKCGHRGHPRHRTCLGCMEDFECE